MRKPVARLTPAGTLCNCHWTGRSAHAPPRRYQASKSGTVLTFGILSLALCGLFGPFAWSMGAGELRRIDAGEVDPGGRGSAQAGMICGMIATILMGIVLLAVVLVAATASGHGNR